ncbi:probable methyltransferase PMT26 [Prosopis cineraria]|uniref:probable methyltransferase PMT26 n=1 Tax=Prosopis cineraria TaxID=364024 RepID=UPI00240FE773|nr:probable methyltransferase PMT26 [Prosopis cineraria]
MASGKYLRIDNRRSSSSYWSTVTVVFVALCLVGVWMMTSSSVVPVQNADSTHESKNEVSEKTEVEKQVNDRNKGNSQQFRDDQSDLPVDTTMVDDVSKSNSNVPEYTVSNKDKKETSNMEEAEDNTVKKKSDSYEGENKSDSIDNRKFNSDGNENQSYGPSETTDSKIEEKVEQRTNNESDESSSEKKTDDYVQSQSSKAVYPSGVQSELLNESTTRIGSFSTQASESKSVKESQNLSKQPSSVYNWKLCNVTSGPDFIPCLDNWQAIRNLRTTKHYEHRERHCPAESPTCLVPLPEGYRTPIEWPRSRDKIWYHNVPHTMLAQYKGHQNWVKMAGEYLTFPGGGTQFQHGALHYIDFIQQSVPEVEWGKHTRVVLDVGCGVASFGGFLFERDVLTMSFAPKDEHEAQVQFALERGVPAISAVMGTKRLPFPGKVFDAVHCARCRVPWHVEGGKLLLELNRVLRPGGLFLWSATPVYQRQAEDVEIWEAMKVLTKGMCWEVVSIQRDRLNKVGIAIYRKPKSNECYMKRLEDEPSLCPDFDDPNAAWNVPLQACMHKAPENSTERGYKWPEEWPARLSKPPYWLLSSQVGVYGKPASEDFTADYENWKNIVSGSYLNGIGVNWSKVRNVMDMRSVYGGFAAALRDLDVWVMNVVSIDAADTLPIIYERGLFGIYHDWCESFSTYPRSYDLLHANNLFSKLKKSCNLTGVVTEVDRILRPGGKFLVRDNSVMIKEIEGMVKTLHWEILTSYSKNKNGFLCAQKSTWRPKKRETILYALALPKDLQRDQNIDKVIP